MDIEVGGIQEVETKVERVRAYLAQNHLAAILINRRDNFAWLTAGRDNHVSAGSDTGMVSLLVTPNDRFLLANRIELGRVTDEEIGDQGWTVRSFDWFEPNAMRDAVRSIVGDGSLAADIPLTGARPLDSAFDQLRADLLPTEMARYREVGKIMTLAVIHTCESIHPGMTEHEIAADLGRRVRAQGGQPGVVLIATDERIAKYRHPIATSKPLRNEAMIVLGGSKWGLQVSITRFVTFHQLSDGLRRKWADVHQVAAYFTLASRPGRAWSDIFRGATEAYKKLGWAEEWPLHHQGGPTGYRGREFTATSHSSGIVSPHQAIAWNPSITGTKTEDTILVTNDGHEFITRHGAWPMVDAHYEGQQLRFADVLDRRHVVSRYA